MVIINAVAMPMSYVVAIGYLAAYVSMPAKKLADMDLMSTLKKPNWNIWASVTINSQLAGLNRSIDGITQFIKKKGLNKFHETFLIQEPSGLVDSKMSRSLFTRLHEVGYPTIVLHEQHRMIKGTVRCCAEILDGKIGITNAGLIKMIHRPRARNAAELVLQTGASVNAGPGDKDREVTSRQTGAGGNDRQDDWQKRD